MPVPTFTHIDFDKDDNPYNDGSGYLEKFTSLSQNFTTLAEYVALVEFSVEQTTQNIMDQTEADRVAIQGLITTTVGTLTAAQAADRLLAQQAAQTSTNNTLAAAAIAASISDYSARVQVMTKARNIPNIKAISIDVAEGWHKHIAKILKNETRPLGNFLGDFASASAAWDPTGKTSAPGAGDYYWNTADNKQQELTTLNNSTQVFRGSQSDMPAVFATVVSGSGFTLRLFIFDLTDPLMPMWGEWAAGTDRILTLTGSPGNCAVAAICWHEGVLYIVQNGTNGQGLYAFDFISGNFYYRSVSGYTLGSNLLTRRNTSVNGLTKLLSTASNYVLLSSTVNHIVAEDGFVATATNSGISVVKPDRTVIHLADTSNAFRRVAIVNGRLYGLRSSSSNQIYDFGPLKALGASFSHVSIYSAASWPYLSSAASSSQITDMIAAGDSLVLSNQLGIDQIWPNPEDKNSGLIAHQDTRFACPPMKKPEFMMLGEFYEGALFTEVDEDFSAGNGGWSFNGSAEWDEANGQIVLTDTGGVASKVFPITPGWYAIRFEPGTINPGSNVEFDIAGSYEATFQTSTTRIFYFTGTTGSLRIRSAGGPRSMSRFAIKQIIKNSKAFEFSYRSANHYRDTNYVTSYDIAGSNHASVHGSLVAAAEFLGGVSGIKGFDSPDDFMDTANPWDGVGTGEAYLAGAFKCPPSSVSEILLGIAYHNGSAFEGSRVQFDMLVTTSALRAYVTSNAGASNVTATALSTYDDSQLHTFVFRKTATHYLLDIDDEQVAAVAVGSHGNLTFHASAKLFFGFDGVNTSAPNITLWFGGGGKVSLTDEEVSLMHIHMRNRILGKAVLDGIPTALAYDPVRKAVEMVGATYRQTMQDGAITSSVAHGQGTSPGVATGPRREFGVGGTTGVQLSVPERNLREYEPRLVKEYFTLDYAANGTDVVFPALTNATEMAKVKDARPVYVSDAGEVIPDDVAGWTLADYGLGRMLPKFTVAPSNTNIVSVTWEREVYR